VTQGQRVHLFDAAPQDRALRQIHEGAVERLVQVHVLRERVDREPFQQSHLCRQLTQSIELGHVGEPLGGQSRRGAFEDGAHLNRIHDLGNRELPHRETTGQDNVEKPDVREPLEREADWCPRHAEPRHLLRPEP
jgi:hypothetical protein